MMQTLANSAADSLMARLAALGYAQLDADTLDAHARDQVRLMLMLSADPVKYPEVADNAVIVPEIMKALPAAVCPVAYADLAQSALIARRFGVLKFPALLFLCHGEYVGVIAGLRDWPDIVHETAAMLVAPTRRPPSVGIPVAQAKQGGCA